MILHVTEAKFLGEYRIFLSFHDGNSGVVDFAEGNLFQGSVFGPLKDPAYFQAFRLDPELNTLVWPNGADLSPEYLESKATQLHQKVG